MNGKVVQLGDKATLEDAIFVNNKPILRKEERSITLIMNKPKGLLCTNSDPHADRTVFDLLPPDLQRQRLFCAGRLDKDSEVYSSLQTTATWPIASRTPAIK